MTPTLSLNMLFPDHIGNPLNLDLISAKSTQDFLSEFEILSFWCFFFFLGYYALAAFFVSHPQACFSMGVQLCARKGEVSKN